MHYADPDESDHHGDDPATSAICARDRQETAHQEHDGHGGFRGREERRKGQRRSAAAGESHCVEGQSGHERSGNRDEGNEQQRERRARRPSRGKRGDQEQCPFDESVHDGRGDRERVDPDDRERSAHKIPSQDEAISETVEREEGGGGPHDAYGPRPNERTFEEAPSEESSNVQPGEEERRGST